MNTGKMGPDPYLDPYLLFTKGRLRRNALRLLRPTELIGCKQGKSLLIGCKQGKSL